MLVEYTEFHHNGAGDGYSHNFYIGQVRSFTLQFCSSRQAKVGHLAKSRAQANFILYNRLMGAGCRQFESGRPDHSYYFGKQPTA